MIARIRKCYKGDIMYKIMIIEDDNKIRKLMCEKLNQYNYETVVVDEFSNIKEKYLEEKPDLILLDINLPNYDGFFWCREIRTVSKVPIIFVSARFSDMDQVLAIEHGGDDYIVKPFSFDLLLAKIKSVLRRAYGEYRDSESLDLVNLEGLYIMKSQSSIRYGEVEAELSKKEFRLLNILAENIDEIVSREELLEELWDDTEFVDDNTLSVNITRLRKRMEDIGIFDSIKTKRGQGYLLKNTWGDR